LFIIGKINERKIFVIKIANTFLAAVKYCIKYWQLQKYQCLIWLQLDRLWCMVNETKALIIHTCAKSVLDLKNTLLKPRHVP